MQQTDDQRDVLVRAKEIGVSFAGRQVLQNVNIEIQRGRIVTLIGPNGAGKTTLFNCITGTMPPTTGSIKFQDTEIVGLPPHEVARQGIARTFQHIRLFNRMTVLDNVMVGNDYKGRTGIFSALSCVRPGWPGRKRVQRRNAARCCLCSGKGFCPA